MILGISGATLVGAALGLTYFFDNEPSAEKAAVLTTQEQGNGVPEPSRSSAPTINPSNSSTASHPRPPQLAARGNAVPVQAKPKVATRTEARKPTFDVVRVNPMGDAVIAGRAAPNASIVVRDGDKPVGKAKADSRGEWVVIPDKPLPKGSRELTLSSKTQDGTAAQSDRNVVIMVPGRAPQNSATTRANKQPGALAVLVPRKGTTGTSGSVVIQKPSGARPAAMNTMPQKPGTAPEVTIDSVDYDQSGNVTISGNAAPKAPLSVYIDNKHAASGVSDRQGRWRVVPGGALAPGDYTLRVDNVSKGGKVLGRAETQFTRVQAELKGSADSVVSVEPGNSLWRIARRVYGTGIQYTVIFDANREQIRDPDLIYPGQVFFVPHVN